MYMRGVFFVLFLLLSVSSSVLAGFSAGLAGSASTEGIHQELELAVEHQHSGLEARGLLTMTQNLEGVSWNPAWKLQLHSKQSVQLMLGRGMGHHTSSEVFRLLHKDNFTNKTAFLTFHTEQVRLGFLKSVPFKELDFVDAFFVESSLDVGPLTFRGLQLNYAGSRAWGWADVLQAEGRMGAWELVLAGGWQADWINLDRRGLMVRLTKDGPGPHGSFLWQNLPQGFSSPLAKSNRLTPNRVGWQLELGATLKGLELGLALRRQTDEARTRHYRHLRFTLEAMEHQLELEWRLQPTEALILRRTVGDSFWQVDLANLLLRHDRDLGEASYSLRLDGRRRIVRLELQLAGPLDWRIIGKYDFLRNLFHSYLRVRLGKQQRHLQLELGQYDGGSLTAGFHNPARIVFSWRWQF